MSDLKEARALAAAAGEGARGLTMVDANFKGPALALLVKYTVSGVGTVAGAQRKRRREMWSNGIVLPSLEALKQSTGRHDGGKH